MKLFNSLSLTHQKYCLFLSLFLTALFVQTAPLERPSRESLSKLNTLNQTNVPQKQSVSAVSQALEKLEEATKKTENPFNNSQTDREEPELLHDLESTENLALPAPVQKINKAPEKIENLIEFHFENADLESFVKQVEAIYGITFISDDAVEPLIKGARPLKGHKINFRTQKPFTYNQAWNLFISFMQMIGFSVVRHSIDGVYRITTTQNALKMNMPSFIGTNYQDLPDTDELIRYVYFVENSSLETIKAMIDTWRSSSSSFIILQEQKAFVLTDRAHNIKVLMEIVKELDHTTEPQIVSLLKLKYADARQVKELYEKISKIDDQSGSNKLLQKKQSSSRYFPENLRMIVEPRINGLILLGPKDSIRKVEEFISKRIDTSPDQPYAAFYTYQLKYADATTISEILTNANQFGKDTEAGKFGGLRGQDQYIKPMIFVPEKETNTLIIKGDFEGYLRQLEIIEQLDAPPKQVALDMLILSVSVNEKKALGSQIRSKDNAPHGLFGDSVKFQTSGLLGNGIIENQQEGASLGVQRLLGNLLQLVKGAADGNTFLTLGSDAFGVWGVFRALQTIANTEIVADPFLTVSNKTPGVFSTGEERRVATSTVFASGGKNQQGLGQDEAKLTLTVTPQINSDGMILLNITLIFDSYVDPDSQSANKITREIRTTAIAANNEVIALGGLVKTKIIESMSKVPVLGDIPLLGWLLGKNKQKELIKDNLLVLICPRLIDPKETEEVERFTKDRVDQYQMSLSQIHQAATGKDPIAQMFFEDNSAASKAEELMFKSRAKLAGTKRNRASNKKIAHLEKQLPAKKPHLFTTPAEQKKDRFFANDQQKKEQPLEKGKAS
jgi:general secretion pathway protein D